VSRYDGNKRIAVGLSWLDHLPIGSSGRAHPSQAPLPIFPPDSPSPGKTSKNLGAKGPVVSSYDCGEFSSRRAQCET